jgi:long-chain acyl-CoA synthetase
MSLALDLVDTARRAPERVALRLDEVELTYRELDERAGRLAAVLRSRGVAPGDRVGLMLPNVPAFAVAYHGILRAGAVVVPLNVLLKEREVAFYLADSGARMLLGADDAEGALDGIEPLPPVARAGDDTAVILYTSGTTGTPKGAELTHDNLRRNAEVSQAIFALRPEDVLLGALPLFHAFGQTSALNTAIRTGAGLTLLPRFDPGRALEILERDRVTVFLGVPTMYAAMLAHPGAERVDASSLRLCVSGGSSLPAEVMRAFEARFGCQILEGYGLSETSPVCSFNHPDRPRKPGSIGTPIAGVQMRVVDDEGRELAAGEVGEIVVRGHNVMKGYWGQPGATAEAIRDGWLHTGDLARVDEDGYLFVVDRKKDLIIRGGYNVYPREVEEVLYEHPAVREAAVVAVPDPTLGEEVGAAVALRPGCHVEPEELRDFVAERLAAFKYPRRVWLVDELPKGATGKILKSAIAPPRAGGPPRGG